MLLPAQMDEAAVEEMVGTLHRAGVNFFDHSCAPASSLRPPHRNPQLMPLAGRRTAAQTAARRR